MRPHLLLARVSWVSSLVYGVLCGWWPVGGVILCEDWSRLRVVLAEKGAGEGLLPVDVLCGGKAVVCFRKCVM